MVVGSSRTSSVLVLAVGVAVTALWWVALVMGTGRSGDDVVVPVITGCVVSLACVAASWWRDRGFRAAGRHLEQARHSAVTDPLTGLVNRAGLSSELAEALTESRRNGTAVGVLFLDLDRFKLINDCLGHEAGDELLRIVASRLVHTVRSTDVVARLGGDEFVVVCRDLASGGSVTNVARQILASFREPASVRGASQTVAASIGIAIAEPGDGIEPEDLLRDADTAMYRAKRERLGYAVFDDVERSRIVDRMDTERDLLTALDAGQLIVHYQPIVALPDRGVVGFEALVRWDHPERGLLAPERFLSVATQAGLMARIGDLVLRKACAQKALWNRLSPSGHELRISVNVAEQQLLDPHFADNVVAVLDWAGLPPTQLILEITETVVASHLANLEPLRDLQRLGVTFALDDFGTGQSSLSTLSQLDMVSILKVDKGFIADLQRGSADGAIVEAVVSMATALGLRVVAEGVEDLVQVRILQGLGVDMLQGFLFNRPLAAEQLRPDDWLHPVGLDPAPGDPPEAPEDPGVRGPEGEAPRSRSTPRPHPPGTAPDPGTTGPA